MTQKNENDHGGTSLTADAAVSVSASDAAPHVATLATMLKYSEQRVEVYNRKLREWAFPGCTVSPETIKADLQARNVYRSHVEALTAAIAAMIGSGNQASDAKPAVTTRRSAAPNV